MLTGVRVTALQPTWPEELECAYTRVFFNIDGLPPTARGDVDAALLQVQALVQSLGLAQPVGAGVLHAACRELAFG